MIRLPSLEIGKQKIFKDCNIKRQRIAATAFTPNGQIIACETNRTGSGFVSVWSFHAEEFLANKLNRMKAYERFGAIHVLVARLGRGKGWTLAKPCSGCERKLKLSGVLSVFYTEENGSITEIRI
jgi:deoxycytidylate deaminase